MSRGITSAVVVLLAASASTACHRGTTETAEAGAAPASGLSLGDAGAGLGLAAGGLLGHGAERAPEPLVIPTGSAPPMPSATTAAEREKELVGLLSGHVAPGSLPVVPTNPPTRFDLGLRDRLTSPTRFEPTVRVMKIDVEGPLDKNDVARIVAGSRARLRACYTNALAQNPGLQGELRVRIETLPSGDVKSVAFTPVAGSDPVAKHGALTECVSNVSKRLYFPHFDAGTSVVSYEATFTANGDTAVR